MKFIPHILILLLCCIGYSGSSFLVAAMKFNIPNELVDEVEKVKSEERAEIRRKTIYGEASEAVDDSSQANTADEKETGEISGAEEVFTVNNEPEIETEEKPLDADSGRVVGRVIDQETGIAIEGVAVLVEGTELGTLTDASGAFGIDSVPAGSYTLSFVKSGYIPANVTENKVVEGEVTTLDFALPPRPAELSDEVYELQDFTVTAEQASQLVALVDLKQASVGQVDFLSSEDFSRFVGSNIADLVGRLAGVNVVEGQFAVVRGLGDRYNSTLLNDLPVPSPDPVRQGVQLDLFPTSVVEGVVAEKAFAPSLPSNSSGAAFNLISRSYPEEFTAWLKAGVSVNENAKSSLLRNGNVDGFQGTPGGDSGFNFSDVLGRSTVSPSGSEFAAIGDSVGDGAFEFGGRSYGVGFGDTYATPWGGSVGFVTSLSYSSSSSTLIGTQQDRFGQNSFTSPFPLFFPSVPGSQSVGTLPGSGLLYDFTQSTVSEDSSFLLGAGIVLDKAEKHKLDFTYLRSRSNISEASRRENGFLPELEPGAPDRGFGQSTFATNTLIIADLIKGRPGSEPDPSADPDDPLPPTLTQGQDILSFEQRTLETKQISGDHIFEGLGRDLITFSWGISDSKASSIIGNPDEDNFVGGQTSLFYLQNVTGRTLDEPIGSPAITLPESVPDGGFLFGGDSAIVDGFTEDVIRNTARTIRDEQFAYRADVTIDLTDAISLELGVFDEELEREVVQSDDIITIDGANVTTGATLQEFVEATLTSSDVFDVSLDSFAEVSREVTDQYFQVNTSFFDNFEAVFGFRASDVQMSSSGFSELVPGFSLTGSPSSFTETLLVGNVDLNNGDLLGFGSSDPADAVVSGEIDETFLLPAISLKYTFFENWVLRFSYGQTYALPSPRELSPVFTVDTFTGDRVVGNPTLIPSDVENLGVRLERTFADGVTSMSVSVFQKRIENPIEQIGLNHSVTGIDVQSFINNENTATVLGLELEGRLGLGLVDNWFDQFDWGFLQYFSVGGNVAYIDAEVGYPEVVEISYINTNTGESVFSDGAGNTEIPDSRRLFDQPEWTVNADVSFQHPEWGTSITAAINAQSDVLSSVGTGSSLTVDQFTSAFYQLDLTIRQSFGDRWELSFSAENLTDSERGIEYSQDLVDEEIQRFSFREGRSYSISLTCNF